MTGPAWAVTTETWTPKSASFFSIRREVNSRVSVETVSWTGGGGSSRLSGGNWLSVISANRACCFSFSTRSDLGTTVTAGSMRTGCSWTSFSCLATTTSARACTATSPTLRSSRACQEFLMPRSPSSSQEPILSATTSHEKPKNRLAPMANRTSSSRVAPV